MKIQFNMSYHIDNEVLTGIQEVHVIQKTFEDREHTLLEFSSKEIEYTFTAGPEYLKRWIREGIITIIP